MVLINPPVKRQKGHHYYSMPANRIHKRKDGRWVYSSPLVGGKRKQLTSRVDETYTQFKKRCDALDKRERQVGIEMTFDDLFTRWAADKWPEETHDADITKRLYRDHFKPVFGSYKASSITRAQLYKHLMLKRAEGYSDSTVSKIKGCYTRPINWAINTLGLDLENVARGLRLPKRKVNASDEDERVDFYTQEDLDRFFAEAPSSKWEGYFYLLLYTGMRPSESLGLKWSDVSSKYISIKRSITSIGIGKLKTKNAYRDIPVTKEINNAV